MSKNVFIYSGATSYGEAFELTELLKKAGIVVDLIHESLTRNSKRLLHAGQDHAASGEVIVIVHSAEFCDPNPLAAHFTYLVDLVLEINTGLFVNVLPLPIFGRWDSVSFNLLKNDSATRAKDLSLLIAQIKKMVG